MQRSKLKTGLIIISSIFPLYGLFYLGWSPFNTSTIYIIETLILLFFFELRIFIKAFNGIYETLVPGFFILFPALLFTTVQLAISSIMFATTRNQLFWSEIGDMALSAVSSMYVAILLIFINNIMDLKYFIKNKDYKEVERNKTKKAAQGLGVRMITMQFTVIIGGIIAKATNNPALGVSSLILVQMFLNLKEYFSIRD